MSIFRATHSGLSLFLFAMLFCIALTVRAQTPSPSPTPSPPHPLESQFLKNILSDQKAIWTAPFHLDRHDAKWMVPSGMGLMALVTTDRNTGDFIARFDRPVKASRAISQAGAVYSLGAAAASFYLMGRAKNNDQARETGVLAAEALINSVIVENALKTAFQRVRPLTGVERSEFFDGGESFPSGHSTQVWAVAAIVANEYKHRRSVQIVAYSVATAVSLSRVTAHKHYFSDVLAGSALGYGIGRYVYRAHRQESHSTIDASMNSASHWPTISPAIDRRIHSYCVGLTWNF
jgi:membrane-associated phospholipid phosphatase